MESRKGGVTEMIKQLQKKYALSQQGAKDLIKGCIACVFQNISFMFPVGLLYSLVSDLMSGNITAKRVCMPPVASSASD